MGYLKQKNYQQVISPNIIDIDEVAERHGISSETIRRWITSGLLFPVTIGGKMYLSNEFLDDTIQDLLAGGPPLKSLLHRVRSKMREQAVPV